MSTSAGEAVGVGPDQAGIDRKGLARFV